MKQIRDRTGSQRTRATPQHTEHINPPPTVPIMRLLSTPRNFFTWFLATKNTNYSIISRSMLSCFYPLSLCFFIHFVYSTLADSFVLPAIERVSVVRAGNGQLRRAPHNESTPTEATISSYIDFMRLNGQFFTNIQFFTRTSRGGVFVYVSLLSETIRLPQNSSRCYYHYYCALDNKCSAPGATRE